MDKTKLKVIQDQLHDDLEDVLKKHGLLLSRYSGINDPTPEGVFKIHLTLRDANIKDEDGKAIEAGEITWGKYASFYDLPPDALGKSININSKRFRIKGLRDDTRSKKTVILEDGTGKIFVAKPEWVKHALLNEA